MTIEDGVLTITDDSTNNVAGGGMVLSVALPANVLNGTTGLVIDFNFGAWSMVQITEMYAVNEEDFYKLSVHNNEATVSVSSGTSVATPNSYRDSSYWGGAVHTAFQTISYTMQNLAQFNATDSAYVVTYSLPMMNFSQYSEAFFGFTAVTAAGDATVTINGKSYTYDLYDGYVYVKMLIKDGVLTVIGDGANNLGQILIRVELPETVVYGEEALKIEWSTAGWSQVEITEMQTLTYAEHVK